MSLSFRSIYVDLPDHAYFGDIFDVESGNRIGSIRRPYQTITAQRAVANGDKWELRDRAGNFLGAYNIRPTRHQIARLFNLG